jgi:hypothetical protein
MEAAGSHGDSQVTVLGTESRSEHGAARVTDWPGPGSPAGAATLRLGTTVTSTFQTDRHVTVT